MIRNNRFKIFFLTCFVLAAAEARIDYLLEGNKFYEKGEYASAISQYKLAIQEGQNLSFAWFNLGNCFAQQKEFSQAITAYRRSVELAPQFVPSWLVLGDVYTLYGSIGDAMYCYRRVVELEEDNSYAHKWLGENALKAGDVTEAMRSFEASLKIDPDQIEVYFALAEAHSAIKDYSGATEVLQDAVLLSPEVNDRIYSYLGYLFEQAGDSRKAVRAYEDALAFNPKDKALYLRIAKLQQDEDADFLALLILEEALKNGMKDPEIYLERGLIYFEQKRLENALEEYKAAYLLGSHRGRIGIENVSAMYWNQGKKEKAREVLSLIQ